jgi:hypothetical protein
MRLNFPAVWSSINFCHAAISFSDGAINPPDCRMRRFVLAINFNSLRIAKSDQKTEIRSDGIKPRKILRLAIHYTSKRREFFQDQFRRNQG